MAANVLNSEQAVQMSVFVVRAFVKLREVLATHKELAVKLTELDADALVKLHDDRASEKRIIEFGTLASFLPRDGKETSRKRLVKFGRERRHIANQRREFIGRHITSQRDNVEAGAANAGIEQQLTNTVSPFGGALGQDRVFEHWQHQSRVAACLNVEALQHIRNRGAGSQC